MAPAGRAARVGAAIVNYRSTSDTLECVDTLLRSDWLDLQVTVVDNDSPENIDPELSRQLPGQVRYLQTGANLGYAAGNNLAIREHLDAGCDYVLVLNPDARVAPDTLGRLVATADRLPTAGFVGPRLLDGAQPGRVIQSDGGRIEWKRGAAPVHVNVGKPADATPEGQTQVDYVTGSCALISRRVLEDVGLFPEDYFLYFEETDFAVRAARRGWASIVDRAVIAKHFRRSTTDVPSRAYLYYLTRNRGLFANRYLPTPDAVELAFADLDRRFLGPWRKRVAKAAPDLVELFDTVVEMAKNDARDGRTGERRELLRYHRQGVPGWSP